MMRACRHLRLGTMMAVGRMTVPLLAARRRSTKAEGVPHISTSSQAKVSTSSSDSLAAFHPGIASTWLTAVSNKMIQPQHVAPSSRKLAWWACPECAHQFNKRIDLHVAAGGVCPKCKFKPPLCVKTSTKARNGELSVESLVSSLKASEFQSLDVIHRCRPDSSRPTLAAPHASRVKKSVADGSYLRLKDTRNLLPMLAKNYEKEKDKIASDEIIYISPKLDGIRCIAAYDRSNKRILFFSRSGTLFECCDAFIDPYLQSAFEQDPTLVLDGELYNDSSNQHKMRMASRTSASPIIDLLLEVGNEVTAGAGRIAKRLIQFRRSSTTMGHKGSIVSFDQLASAVRTTRDRRTPDVEALQKKLQYHIFDVLHASCFSKDTAVSYRHRFAYLLKCLVQLHERNAEKFGQSYDPNVLRLVPCLPCVKSAVDDALRAVIKAGFEGIMVRRDSLKGNHLTFTAENVQSGSQGNNRLRRNTASGDPTGVTAIIHQARECIKGAGASVSPKSAKDTSGGYAYGQRSCTLLKYKVMQDDEFVIVSAVEGKGKWKGSLGAFVCETKDRSHTFTVAPATTEARRKDMWQHWEQQYHGKSLTVQFQEITPDGVPRFPVGKCVRGAPDGADWL